MSTSQHFLTFPCVLSLTIEVSSDSDIARILSRVRGMVTLPVNGNRSGSRN